VENALRTLLADGTFRPGDPLPPQRTLAADFSVSRDTVQRVLRRLTDEGLIQSRQGSGLRVLKVPDIPATERQSGRQGRALLGPLIRKAFEEPSVSLDVYTLTSETLVGHIRVQAERIAAGEIAPERVSVRMLLPSEERPLNYPRAKDPDDQRVWERWKEMAHFRQNEMRDLMARLSGTVEVELDIRKTPQTPQFRLYIFNDSEMLFGPYEVIERTIFQEDSFQVEALDVLGLGSPLSHHGREEDDDSHDSTFFTSMQGWFESNWNLLGQSNATG